METTLATNESVGTILLQTREHYGVSRALAAERTKIPERFLEMLEDDAYADLPDDVYAKIFLKTYCLFLGLDTPTILELYRGQRALDAAMSRVEARRRHPLTSVPTKQLIVAPKLIRIALAAAAFIGLLGYVGWSLLKIVAPPQISLQSPPDGLVTVERTIAIEGTTEPEVTLQINGEDVAVSNDGRFSDTLTLQDGLNTVRISAFKKHSEEMVVTRRIIVQPKPAPPPLPAP